MVLLRAMFPIYSRTLSKLTVPEVWEAIRALKTTVKEHLEEFGETNNCCPGASRVTGLQDGRYCHKMPHEISHTVCQKACGRLRSSWKISLWSDETKMQAFCHQTKHHVLHQHHFVEMLCKIQALNDAIWPLETNDLH